MKQRKFLLMVLLMLPIMIFAQIDYYSEIQPIFNSNCTSCHTAEHSSGLDLTGSASYDDLVNVESSGYAPALRVESFSPDNSVLYNKISDTGVYGNIMPPSGSISQNDIALIAGWISEGALETPDTGEGDIVLSLGDVEVESYATDVVVQANLENTMDDVGGLQFDVIQSPNMLPLTDVVAVGRAEGFDVSFNDFGEGHIRVVLVSIAGGNIEAGDGVILELYYDASDFGSAVVTLSLSGLIVSDPDGNELDASVGEPAIIAVGTTVSLYVEGGTADAGEQVDISMSLTNSTGVGGLQFDLVDTPNDLTIDDVSVTGRAEGFEAEWTEISGALRVILWDPDNGLIAEGDGDIINITATIGDYTHAGDINLSFDNVVVSDDLGGAIWIAELGEGAVTVYPGFLEPPVDLIAESGLDGHVPLAWEEPTGGGGEPEPADVLIQIFTDNYPLETSWDLMDQAGNYIDGISPGDLSGLLTLYEWEIGLDGGTYTWTIYDTFGDGICCAYGEGYYNIYVGGNLIATGGEFGTSESVTFDTGGRAMSISHGSYAEPPGYAKGEVLPNIDIPIIIETTVFEQRKSGLNLAEWVAGGENDTYDVTRELEAYNIYRSTTSGSGYELLDVVNSGTLEYDDTSVENGSWYFYVVSADYGEMGESGYSNEAAALPAEWVTMSLSNGAAISGFVDTIYVSLENASPVAEFSFTILDIPNAVVAEDVVTTARTAGFTVEFEELAGGSMTASFSGGEVEPGEGTIAAIAYRASSTSEVVADLIFTQADAAGPEGNIFNVGTEGGSFEIFIETQYAMMGGGYADPGGEGTVELSLTNTQPIYGFELFIIDNPDVLEGISVQATERIPGSIVVSGFETNGIYWITAVGFSNEAIQPGTGPIAEITFAVDPSAEMETIVNMDFGSYQFWGPGQSEIYTLVSANDFAIGTPEALFSIGSGSANVGEEGTYTIDLSNTVDVFGLQVFIEDFPNWLTVTDVTMTDRIPSDASMSWNEFSDGSLRILEFDMTPPVEAITPGEGPIFVVTVNVSAGAEEGAVGLNYTEAAASDAEGEPTIFTFGMGDWFGIGESGIVNNMIGFIPDRYALHQNYPNPFNPTTTIAYDLSQAGQTRVSVLNLLGQEVAILTDGYLDAGQYRIIWNGRDGAGSPVNSGVYFYRVESSNFADTKKMILLK